MATVAKRRGRYVLDFYDHQGQRRWQTMPAGTTLKEDRAKLHEIEISVGRGAYIPPKQAPTLQALPDEWIDLKRQNIRGSTLKTYQWQLKHLESIGAIRVDRITTKTIEKWIAKERANGVGLVTLRKVIINLGSVL